MTYYILDAFTNQPFGGNPAGVVLLESNCFPEEKLMLQIAAELRYSETAFIRRHSDKEFTLHSHWGWNSKVFISNWLQGCSCLQK